MINDKLHVEVMNCDYIIKNTYILYKNDSKLYKFNYHLINK